MPAQLVVCVDLSPFDMSAGPSQVEKTPAVIKKGLKKEEAEALKAKLEAGTAFTNDSVWLPWQSVALILGVTHVPADVLGVLRSWGQDQPQVGMCRSPAVKLLGHT